MVISSEIHPEKYYGQLFFHKKKKIRPTSQNGRSPILRSNLKTLSGIEILFSHYLTYPYSFFG